MNMYNGIMGLNNVQRIGTVVDVGGRSESLAPRERRGGISLPVHVWRALDTIVALRTAAFEKMGGKTKVSPSDELELAAKAHIKAFAKKNGALPILAVEKKKKPDAGATPFIVGPAEEKYVAKLAETLGEELLAELNDEDVVDHDAA